ncbi:MAG: hypothetical protein KA184_02615 [Candidatus Hydrogenedentes bacterium]|nr:hypothetical protein [Candidatus Hydrogenedentota bacterium]
MSPRISQACLLLAVSALLAGCPPPEGWPKPPFDTTGSYLGVWSGRSNEEAERQQIIEDCPLSLKLVQDLTRPYPGDHSVSGAVTVDYSCIDLPDWVEETPPSTVTVSGLLGDGGQLTLLSGGCAPGMCVVLTLAGQGENLDNDAEMDRYAGSWAYLVLLAGVPPFGITGTFDVSAVEPL